MRMAWELRLAVDSRQGEIALVATGGRPFLELEVLSFVAR
ncbi:MAG: hypothetical protein QOH00_3192 [Gaiellales bacterium]|nr:hypothetical protein [Gaiellales bacterium]